MDTDLKLSQSVGWTFASSGLWTGGSQTPPPLSISPSFLPGWDQGWPAFTTSGCCWGATPNAQTSTGSDAGNLVSLPVDVSVPGRMPPGSEKDWLVVNWFSLVRLLVLGSGSQASLGASSSRSQSQARKNQSMPIPRRYVLVVLKGWSPFHVSDSHLFSFSVQKKNSLQMTWLYELKKQLNRTF